MGTYRNEMRDRDQWRPESWRPADDRDRDRDRDERDRYRGDIDERYQARGSREDTGYERDRDMSHGRMGQGDPYETTGYGYGGDAPMMGDREGYRYGDRGGRGYGEQGGGFGGGMSGGQSYGGGVSRGRERDLGAYRETRDFRGQSGAQAGGDYRSGPGENRGGDYRTGGGQGDGRG